MPLVFHGLFRGIHFFPCNFHLQAIHQPRPLGLMETECRMPKNLKTRNWILFGVLFAAATFMYISIIVKMS